MKNNLLSEKLIYTGDSLTPTHLHLCTYNETEIQETSGDSFQSIKNSLDNERTNWLQIHGMKDTETIREICSHFEIDFLILQDILNADHPTKIATRPVEPADILRANRMLYAAGGLALVLCALLRFVILWR